MKARAREIYNRTTAQIAAAGGEAKEAGTFGALSDIAAKMVDIYESTDAPVSASHERPEWQRSEAMIARAAGISAVIDRLDAFAENTTDQSLETAKAGVRAG